MIGKTIGHLQIISELGKGGMGVVYLAEHPILNKKFAVKSLSPALTQDPQFRERFYQEARNQALLDHPNIVQATDFFEEEGQFYFVMEYVDGQDLGKMIKEKGALPEKQALSIFKNVLEGLDFAHHKGIIHRDIKPSNILIDQTGRARIMDFGIAVMFGAERLTATGSTVGSPWYMSPEQITHPKDIDHRSDVYSAGIVLYEMLTGAVPFDGDSDWSVKNQQVNAPRPNPHNKNQQIAPELAQMVVKAMDTVPDNRFQGCAEFLQVIKAYEASKEKEPERPWKKLLGILAVIAMLSMGFAAYVYWFKAPQKTVVIRPDPQQEHKSAAILIDGALKEALFVCRECKDIQLKQKNLQIAQDLGEADLVAEYKKAIADKEQNVRDSMSRYNDSIKKLSGLTRTIVSEEFAKQTAGPTPQDSFGKAQFDQLKRHYQTYLDNQSSVDVETMRQLCMQE